MNNNVFIFFALLSLLFSCASAPDEKKRSRADIYYTHGTSNLMKKNYTEALSLLLKAEALRPDDAKINNNLGMAYFFKKAPTKAEHHLKRAIQINPKNSDAKVNLASIYSRLGRSKEAKKLYQKVIKDIIYEHPYRALYGLALIHMEEKNVVVAIDYLNKAVQEKNDFCPAQFKLGEISEMQRNFTEAYNRYKKASLGVCVSQPQPHYQQALVLIKLRRYQDARQKLNDIVERFSTTRYSQLAQAKLNDIDGLGSFELTKDDIIRKHKKRRKSAESYKNSSF